MAKKTTFEWECDVCRRSFIVTDAQPEHLRNPWGWVEITLAHQWVLCTECKDWTEGVLQHERSAHEADDEESDSA